MSLQTPPAQRLLAQGVIASTLLLVRSMQGGADASVVRRLMHDRRHMLARLPLQEAGGEQGATWALRAAVAESDQTLEALLS